MPQPWQHLWVQFDSGYDVSGLLLYDLIVQLISFGEAEGFIAATGTTNIDLRKIYEQDEQLKKLRLEFGPQSQEIGDFSDQIDRETPSIPLKTVIQTIGYFGWEMVQMQAEFYSGVIKEQTKELTLNASFSSMFFKRPC